MSDYHLQLEQSEKIYKFFSIYLYSYLAINPFIYSIFFKSYECYMSDIGLETKDTKMNKTHSPLIRTHTLEKTNSHVNKELI